MVTGSLPLPNLGLETDARKRAIAFMNTWLVSFLETGC